MAIAPIGPAALPHLGAGITEGPPAAASKSFSRLLNDLLAKTATQQVQADQSIMELATGKTENLHRIFLDVIKAEVSMRMILEVRNRLIEGYQQVMQMQV